MAVVVELIFVEQFREHRVREVAIAELLEIEGEGGARGLRLAHDRAQSVLDRGDAAGEVDRVDL